MKNIELKIKVSEFASIEKTLKSVGAKYQGVLRQIDTYFNASQGRLKLREINNKKFELIYYERPDKAAKKLSDYFLLPLNKTQTKELKNILVKSIGSKVIVNKNRGFWLWKNTRIHLDEVAKLGKFLELETVLGKITEAQGKKEYAQIYELLKLDKYKKIKKSYSDLLLK